MSMNAFIDNLAASGFSCFTTTQVAKDLRLSIVAARAAIRRQREKGRIATPFGGFHVIVPPEYRALGCLPADQFIPQLMAHLKLPYYAGLLTAAHLHGAAHQSPMIFQVVVAKNQKAIHCGSVRVKFVARHNIKKISLVQQNTLRGFLNVSTLEATAIDLVGYAEHAGGLSNVATILAELKEKLDSKKLVAMAKQSPLPWAQRLGFLLDIVDAKNLTEPLANYISSCVKDYVLLNKKASRKKSLRNKQWKLWINEQVETDL